MCISGVRAQIDMKRLTFILAVLVLAAASIMSVRLRYFNVEADGSVLVLTWETELEQGVRSFELFRKSGQSVDYTLVGSLAAHGVSVPYTIRDTQIYKAPAALLDYKLEAVLESGLRMQLAERKVNYTSTALRRSWGSIKAMFQD